jgi:hypothetical protein
MRSLGMPLFQKRGPLARMPSCCVSGPNYTLTHEGSQAPGSCFATCLNVQQRCLAWQQMSHSHLYVWKLREHGVDEAPQFL